MSPIDSGIHRRKVRSYVKRAGRVTPSQTRALTELWPAYGIDPEVGDLCAAFVRSAPIVLEIGFGDGAAFVAQAAADPERNYLGIEVHDPGIGHCLLLADEHKLRNLRIVNGDALETLSERVPDGCLQRLNLYFPDPWPKKRHHKRRIVQPRFLSLAARKLEPHGRLCIATDWENYAEHIDDVLRETPDFEVVKRVQHRGDQPLDRPTTKFERRGLRKGHAIWDWRLARR